MNFVFCINKFKSVSNLLYVSMNFVFCINKSKSISKSINLEYKVESILTSVCSVLPFVSYKSYLDEDKK